MIINLPGNWTGNVISEYLRYSKYLNTMFINFKQEFNFKFIPKYSFNICCNKYHICVKLGGLRCLNFLYQPALFLR